MLYTIYVSCSLRKSAPQIVHLTYFRFSQEAHWNFNQMPRIFFRFHPKLPGRSPRFPPKSLGVSPKFTGFPLEFRPNPQDCPSDSTQNCQGVAQDFHPISMDFNEIHRTSIGISAKSTGICSDSTPTCQGGAHDFHSVSLDFHRNPLEIHWNVGQIHRIFFRFHPNLPGRCSRFVQFYPIPLDYHRNSQEFPRCDDLGSRSQTVWRCTSRTLDEKYTPQKKSNEINACGYIQVKLEKIIN